MLTERITGVSWEDFIRSRLTDRLRMRVSFTIDALASGPDSAVPYSMDDDTRLRAPLLPISVPAAGGINTSIADIANWLRFHLDQGEFEGQKLLSPSLIRELQTPRVHVAAPDFVEVGDSHYGLGLGTYTYRGDRVVGHSGGWLGWGTLMTMLPDRGAGLAILTNREPNAATTIVTRYLLDRLCGMDVIPWFDRFHDVRRKFLAQVDVDRATRREVRRAGTRPSHDLADYAGKYEHPAYGRIVIAMADGGLHWAYRGMSAALAHRHYDTFELPKIPDRLHPDNLAINFTVDRDGNIASLSAAFEPTTSDIVFTRLAWGDCLDPAFRARCVGRYVHGSQTHVVSLDAEGQLLLKPSDQPLYRLRPFQDRTFGIVEAECYRLEFRRTADGSVDQIVFHQPNGTFLAHRSENDDG